MRKINDPPEPKTGDELVVLYSEYLKKLLRDKAVEKNYDDEISIVSYANSSNATWKQEASDYIAWRDACWHYAIEINSKVSNGEIDPPSIEYFLSGAPVLNWS